MKRIILLFGFLMILAVGSMNAQELVVQSFGLSPTNTYAKLHERLDANEDPCAVVIISVADAKQYTVISSTMIGDPIYHSGEILVYLAAGTKHFRIRSDKFGEMDIPLVDAEGEAIRLESHYTYELKLKLVIPEKRRTIVMAEFGYHPSQTSFGAMVGVATKHGAYLRFRSNFGSASSSLECDDSGMLSTGEIPYYKPGASETGRLSFTGGYLYRVAKPLYAYAGVGYGYRTLTWEMNDGTKVENKDHSANGLAAELGVIGQYKRFALSLGVHTINFKYAEMSVGIGYMF